MLSKFWAVPFLFPLSQIVLNQIPLRGCKEEEGQELPGLHPEALQRGTAAETEVPNEGTDPRDLKN